MLETTGVAPTFSLSFATPAFVNGINVNATVASTDNDGTIGAPSSYQTSYDGIVRTDDDEGEDTK